MPRAQGVVYTSPFPTVPIIGVAGNTIVMHARAVIAGAAADLASFISGGYPSWQGRDMGTGVPSVPGGIIISVEPGQAGGVMLTMDGTSVPSAVLGMLVPVAPAQLTIIGNIVPGVIQAFSTSGTVNCQILYLA